MNSSEEWHLDTHHLGRRVLVFDRLASTSTTAAAEAGDTGNDGLVILAREQSAGRGQYGRSWCCTAGQGVLLSALVFPPPALRRPALLTAWAAVSVCETVRHLTGMEASIKWPNDVLLENRKVCGILIEQARGTVVGIGLNVNQTLEDFVAAGLPLAGSLAWFAGRPFEYTEVARVLIRQLDAEYVRLIGGEVQPLQQRWQQRLGLLGKVVLAECTSGRYQGCLRELTFSGMELSGIGGQVWKLPPESVRHVEAVE